MNGLILDSRSKKHKDARCNDLLNYSSLTKNNMTLGRFGRVRFASLRIDLSNLIRPR